MSDTKDKLYYINGNIMYIKAITSLKDNINAYVKDNEQMSGIWKPLGFNLFRRIG